MADTEKHDPSSNKSLFYGVIGIACSVFISLMGYTLLRLTLQGQAITSLETWNDARKESIQRDFTLLQQVRESSYQNQLQIIALEEQVRFLKNSANFHEAQISYIIAWDKRMREQDDPQMRKYPR